MSLILKDEKPVREPHPAGVHDAVCYCIADIGTHHEQTPWGAKDTRQVVVAWELPKLRIEIEKDGKKLDLPRAYSQTYTLNFGSLAKIRQHLELWRGTEFTKEELQGFDIKAVLGACCQLQLVHKTSETTGKKSARIATIIPWEAGRKKIKAENEHQWFSLDEGNDIPANIPKWIREKIENSQEWVAMGQAAGMNNADEPTKEVDEVPWPDEEEVDNMPF